MVASLTNPPVATNTNQLRFQAIFRYFILSFFNNYTYCKSFRESCKSFREFSKSFREFSKSFREFSKSFRESCKLLRESCKSYRDSCQSFRKSCQSFREVTKLLKVTNPSYWISPKNVFFISGIIKSHFKYYNYV